MTWCPEAVDIVWALTGPELFRLLVTVSDCAVDRYEAWLLETICNGILRDSVT